jgi:hypothetical protein
MARWNGLKSSSVERFVFDTEAESINNAVPSESNETKE